MMIVFGILCVIGLGLIGYAVYLIFAPDESTKESMPTLHTGYRPVAALERIVAAAPADPSRQDRLLRMEGQVDSLKHELESARTELASAQQIVDASRKKEAELSSEITRRDDWAAKNDLAIKKIQDEMQSYKVKFVEKEKELQEQFTQQVDLTRTMGEITEKADIVAAQNKERADQIESMKHQIERQLSDL